MATQRDFRRISSDEQETVRKTLKIFSELVTYRNVHAGQWEEAASLVDVDSRNTFMYGSYNFPGQKRTQYQVDASGMLALQQFCAIADSMITPKNRLWHGLETDKYLMKQPGVRKFYEDMRDVVFDYRYRPEGNFHGQNYRIWKSLGAYGNSIMFTDALDRRWHGGRPGLRYKAVPLGEGRPRAARLIPTPMARSRPEPSLRSSAGARLTVSLRWEGNGRPLLRIAERTRSFASRTEPLARPTSAKPTTPPEMSTWTSTTRPSRPRTRLLSTLATMPGRVGSARPLANGGC